MRRLAAGFAIAAILLFAGTGAALPFSAPAWGATSLPDGYAGTLFVWGGQLFGDQSGGIFVSTDAGITWDPLHDDLPNSFIRAFAISSGDPQLMLAAPEGEGIYRSTDGGGSWVQVLPALTVYRLEVDGVAPGLVFAGCEGRGVFRSEDFGETWAQSNDGLAGLNVTGLSVSQSLPGRIAVSFEGLNTGGVLISDDGGATWEEISPTNQRQTAIVISPTDEDLLFVGNGGPWSTDPYGIHVSSNGGVTWENRWPDGEKDDIRTLHVPSAMTSRLLVGTQVWLDPWLPRILSTDDSGATFAAATGIPSVETAILDIDTSPDDADAIYAVGELGLGVIVSGDGGATWAHHELGVAGSNPDLYFQAVAVDPTDPQVVYAGGLGLYRSDDGGGTWNLVADTGEEGGDVYSLAVDASGRLLVGGPGTCSASTDGGATFDDLSAGLPPAGLTRLERDEGSTPAATLAVLYGDGVYRLDDGAGSWVQLGPFGEDIPVLVGRAADGDTIMAAGGDTLYYSEDLGVTWEAAEVTGGSFFGALAIARDPAAGDTALMGTYLGLYASDDGGRTWSVEAPTGLLASPEVGAVEYDPEDPTRIILAVAGGAGVYASEDSGVTYFGAGEGIPEELTGSITGFAHLPGSTHKIWCAVGDGFSGTAGFYHTHDRGISWSEPAPYVDAVSFETDLLALDPGGEEVLGISAMDHVGDPAADGMADLITALADPEDLAEIGQIDAVGEGSFELPVTAGAQEGAGDIRSTCEGCLPELAAQIPVTVGDVLPDGGIPAEDAGADAGDGGGSSRGCGCESAGDCGRSESLSGILASLLLPGV